MKKCVWMFAACAVVVSVVTGCKEEKKLPQPVTDEASDDTARISEPNEITMEQPVAPSADPEKVVARVGKKEIKQADVNKIVDGQVAQYGDRVPAAFQAQMRAEMQPRVLEMLIAQRVLRDEVARREIVLSDDLITERIEEIKKSLPSEMTLEKALAQRGMSMRELLDNIKEGMQFEKLIDAELEGKLVEPTEADAQAFYDEKKAENFTTEEKVQASHILITPETKDDAGWTAAQEKIEALAQDLKDGGDFAELALANSSCPSKERGGDLGAFPRGQMVPEFDAAAFSQEVGVVGDPVKTQFGFHLIKVTDKTVAGEVPFEEVKEDILKSLVNAEKAKAAEAIIDGLKAKADIVLVD